VINGLRPYPEMKPSGLPWLGDVPTHWDVRRNGRLFGARRETGFPDLPILEVSMRSGVRVRDFDAGGRKQEMSDRSKYQRAVRGDIAYNMMRMWQGAVGIAPVDGLVSPAYVVARPFPETNAAYYAHLFRTSAYMHEIDTFSRGIVPDRNRLYWESFKQMPSAHPPLDEQRMIVRFLDWHGTQTVKLIRAKKRIIVLLNEEKRAIINHAVTRGLDPNVKLKPSGILSLGDVPAHWEVKPLKFWASVNRRTLSQNTDPSYTFDYLDISTVATGYLVSKPERLRFENAPSRARRIVLQGDTLISTVRTYLKAIYFVDQEWLDLIASTGFAVLTPSPAIDARFFGFALQSKAFVDQVVANSIGVAYPAISETRLGSLALGLPPSRNEQVAVIEHLRAATADIDLVIEQTQREIALIQEFRSRVIADVVTGNLDVRAAAAALPDVTDLEPVEEPVEDGDLDGIGETEDEEVAA
jgi:type I restriction enzyme, S subunit